jgi:hypothetical protein
VRLVFFLMFCDPILFGLGLCLILFGAATCHWQEIKNNSMLKSTKRINYEGKDVYLFEKTYLFGCLNAIPFEIESGTHRYEFTCQLPASLPASIKTKYGHIFYTLEAFLDIPWNHDKKFKLKFTVVRDDNLNSQPELKLPCKLKASKQFFDCFLFKCNPLLMTVNLPATGFRPGEKIHVKIYYVNNSSVKVRRTVILLRQIVRLYR